MHEYDVDAWDYHVEFSRATYVMARKEHTCISCRRLIAIGEVYRYTVTKTPQGLSQDHEHVYSFICSELTDEEFNERHAALIEHYNKGYDPGRKHRGPITAS